MTDLTLMVADSFSSATHQMPVVMNASAHRKAREARKKRPEKEFDPALHPHDPATGQFTETGGGDGGGSAASDVPHAPKEGGKAQTVYHGSKAAGFEEFKLPDPEKEKMVDRAIGIHLAKDPKLAETFTNVAPDWGGKPAQEGGIYILEIPHDSKFYEVEQKLLPFVEPGTPKTPKNVHTDQVQIGNLVYRTAFKQDEGLFARFLERRWALPKERAEQIADDILHDRPVTQSIISSKPITGLDDYIQKDGVITVWNDKDRTEAVHLFWDEFKDKGWNGLKYINTSPMETEHATDPTSYVVFDPADIKFKYGKDGKKLFIPFGMKEFIARAADDEADDDAGDTGDEGENLTEVELWPETGEDREEFMDRCVQELIPCIGEDNAVDVCTSKWVAARRLGKKGFVTSASLEGTTFKLKIEPCGKSCLSCEGAPAPFKAFDESEHPRDEHGRWTDGGGGGSERDAENVSEFDQGYQTVGHGDTRSGVGMYSGLGNSFTMNDALRKGDTSELAPELKEAINNLDGEINKSVTTADRVVSRGLHGWASIEKFTRPGTTVKDKAFMSATRDESWAKRMFASSPSYDGAVLNISVPKGSNMLTVARSSEDEVILPRDTSLRITKATVTSRRDDGSRNWKIDAELVT